MKNPNLFKRTVAAALVALWVCALEAKAEWLWRYSIWCRYWNLSKFSEKWFVIKSWEWELLMWNWSSYKEDCSNVGDKQECKVINPWRFSISNLGDNRSLVELVQSNIWRQMVGCYRQDLIRNAMTQETDYNLVSLDKPTWKYPDWAAEWFSISKKLWWKSDWVRSWRIVKASSKWTIMSSWEVIVQVWNEWTNFISMSVRDEEMFKKIEEALKTWLVYEIWYNQSYFRNVVAEDTDYNIVSLKAPADAIATTTSWQQVDCNNPQSPNELQACLQLMQQKLQWMQQ